MVQGAECTGWRKVGLFRNGMKLVWLGESEPMGEWLKRRWRDEWGNICRFGEILDPFYVLRRLFSFLIEN
jgi:hypothetical protein